MQGSAKRGREAIPITARAKKGRTRPVTVGSRRAYRLSVVISALAVVATFLLDSRLPQTPAPILFAGVTLAARYGGLGPGMLSTLVCAIGLNILLEDPLGAPAAGESSLLHLAVFVMVAVLVSTLTERMRQAETQARADATRLSILADASRTLTATLSDH